MTTHLCLPATIANLFNESAVIYNEGIVNFLKYEKDISSSSFCQICLFPLIATLI